MYADLFFNGSQLPNYVPHKKAIEKSEIDDHAVTLTSSSKCVWSNRYTGSLVPKRLSLYKRTYVI